MEDCLFCKIIKKEIPTEIVYEDDLVMAFPDIHPIVPVHILIIPKKHIASVNDLTEGEEDERIMGRLFLVAKKIAKDKGLADGGYKLLTAVRKFLIFIFIF